MKSLLRKTVSGILSILPSGTAAFMYTKILSPRPLRYAADRLLLAMLPDTVSLPEGVLEINQRDPVISGALALGAYEPFQTRLFRELLKPGMAVFDIGANIGLYTVIAAGRVGGTGRVIACEPEPASRELLERNIARNGFSNVAVFSCAIADIDGSLPLHLSQTNQGSHSLLGGRDKKNGGASLNVEVRTGDALLREAGVSKIDIIKIDVEGAETLAFRGLHNSLRQDELTVFFEFSPATMRRSQLDPSALLAELLGYGFRLFEIKESCRKLAEIDQPDAFSQKFRGTAYANILALKGTESLPGLTPYLNVI